MSSPRSLSGPPPGTQRIGFAEAEYAEIRSQSVARAMQMRDKPGAYGTSDVEQQEVGLLGEIAVLRWMAQEGWDCFSIADGDGKGNSRGDVAVQPRATSGPTVSSSSNIEVKTSRIQDWPRYERQLDAAQFVRMSCDVIVWCAADSQRPRRFVDVMGWFPRTGLTVAEAGLNSAKRPQVKVQERLRLPRDLHAWLSASQADVPF